ncbi:hypothetical protein [Streptomyces sp. NRRL F-2664]|uniref:hypothetical protein n=1 Tax=Streptomyces sp. NRRL F-2664 TaxID=1463842 RepID=UPI0006912CED|nr:hypothetical protein [Streptomyces sp. NRRL F-2664]
MRIGSIHGSAFSIGGSDHTNTVHHSGTAAAAPGAAELLEAVLALREALVREAPRGADRTALDSELDQVAEQLEGAEAIRPGLVARLREALQRWAPLVESVSAAAALGSLLGTLGG